MALNKEISLWNVITILVMSFGFAMGYTQFKTQTTLKEENLERHLAKHTAEIQTLENKVVILGLQVNTLEVKAEFVEQ